MRWTRCCYLTMKLILCKAIFYAVIVNIWIRFSYTVLWNWVISLFTWKCTRNIVLTSVRNFRLLLGAIDHELICLKWYAHFTHNVVRVLILFPESLFVISASKESHRLTLMYLANDVIQNSRRKGIAAFREAFSNVLEEAATLCR